MADLFPERIKDTSSEARKSATEAFRRTAWHAALGVLNREATAVLIAANAIHGGAALLANDVMRVRVAAQRIAQAREVLR